MGCQALLTLPVGVLRFFILPARSSICGWPESASKRLPEEVDDLMKPLLAHVIARFVHFLGINVSVFLELSLIGVELPSTLKFLPESLHFGMQVLEIFWMSAIHHRLINHLPQLIPVQRLTLVGSHQALDEVDDQLKRLFALWIAQFISMLEKIGSVILESFRKGVELIIINKVLH